MRVPLIHALPWHTFGSTVMYSRQFKDISRFLVIGLVLPLVPQRAEYVRPKECRSPAQLSLFLDIAGSSSLMVALGLGLTPARVKSPLLRPGQSVARLPSPLGVRHARELAAAGGKRAAQGHPKAGRIAGIPDELVQVVDCGACGRGFSVL